MTDNNSGGLEAVIQRIISRVAAPKTTQDMVDQMASELATSDYLRKYSEKRYDAAKRAFTDLYNDDITKLRNISTDNMSKTTRFVDGVDWRIEMSANTPTKRVNVDELRTELIKSGIDVKVIDKCIKKVEKKSSPALIIRAIDVAPRKESAA